MRMSKREWLAQFFRFKPPKDRPAPKAKRPVSAGEWWVDGMGHVVQARTKSEALARLKEFHLGRLPKGLIVSRRAA